MSPNDRQNTMKALTDSIVVSRLFLPFLGPEASCQRSNEEEIWKLVAYRLWKLQDALDNTRNSDRKGNLNYLISFARGYNIPIDSQPTGYEEILAILNPYESIRDALDYLGFDIVLVGAALVKLFGEQMVQTRACVENVTDYKISIAGRDQDILPILINLESALGHLDEYQKSFCQIYGDKPNKKTTNTPHLEVDAIFSKLLILAYDIGGDLLTANGECQILCKYEERIKQLRNLKALSSSKLLYLDQLAFMEDLLWYILRFDIPAYMNSSELTFTLSLSGLTREILRRRELPQVAEWISPEPYQVLTNNLNYCESWMENNRVLNWGKVGEKKKGEPSEFHRCIAAVLWLEYQEYRKSTNKRPHLPIAISTCYDRSLEWACRSLGMPYHVVVPVQAQVFLGDRPQYPWLFLTYSPNEQNNYGAPTQVECTEWKNRDDVALIGPVIVKLHGSPLEPVTHPKGFGDYERTDPYVILSESEYLQATVIPEDALFKYPQWITDHLKTMNDWWFMGYSINDWFIHLRIYQHFSIRMGNNQMNRPNAKVLATNFDSFRTFIFSKLTNTPLNSIDLTTVQEAIKLIPQVQDILLKGVEQ